MNLYHLRYFVKLAQLQHYTKAAAELNITQPSLSHAIAQLEDELGTALFEKDGRNIAITKHGRMFLVEVQRSLDMLDAGINALRLTSTGQGRIDIGLLRTLGTDLIPQLVRGFLDSQPHKEIDFHFHTGITPGLIEGLRRRDYDIVFCSKPEEEGNITFLPVARQELLLAVHKEHPLAERSSIDLADTLDYPHIFFTPSSGLRPIIDGMFRTIGRFPASVPYVVEEDQVIAGMVAHRFGIAVVPEMPILDSLPVKCLSIASPDQERLFYLAVIKDRYLPPIVNELIHYAVVNARL